MPGRLDLRRRSGRQLTPAAAQARERGHAGVDLAASGVAGSEAAAFPADLDAPSAPWSVSRESSAHFIRAGLISMPSSSRTSPLVIDAALSTGLPLISSVRSDVDAWLIAQPRPVN